MDSNSKSPAPADTGDGASQIDRLSGAIYSANNPATDSTQVGPSLRADLIGASTATAAGITANSTTPVLALCRRLLSAGHDPATRLEVYRGATLALVVRSIGEAAELEIGGDGTGFRRARGPDAASPMRKSEVVARTDPPTSPEAVRP